MKPGRHVARNHLPPTPAYGSTRAAPERARGADGDAGSSAPAGEPAAERDGPRRPTRRPPSGAAGGRRTTAGPGGPPRRRPARFTRALARIAATGLAGALAAASLPGVGLAAATAPPTFTDLAPVQWAVPAIEGVAALGVMKGTGPGLFDPQGTTTRAQAAVIFSRFMGWTAPANTRLPFTDAASIPSWALASVAAAAQQGVLRGEADGGFHPNDPVTWDQMAIIVARTFGYPAVASGQAAGLLDQLPHGSATPSWAAQAVAADVQAGDFPGTLAAVYQADQPVTRAAMAAFLLAAAPSGANPDLLAGRATAVSGTSLTLLTPSGATSLTVPSQAPVYVGDSLSNASALSAGDSLQIVAAGGQATWVDVTAVPAGSPAPAANPAPTPASTSQPTVATLRFDPAPVAPTGALAAGSSVSVVLQALGASGQAASGTSIDIAFQQATGGGSARVGGTTLTATPQPFSTDGNGDITITYIAPTNPSAPGTDSILANYTAGGSAVVAEDGYAFAASAAATVPNSTLTGTIQSVNGSQSITLTLTSGSTTVVGLAPYCAVTLNGQSGSTASLAAGQQATVSVNAQGQASYVAATTEGTATVGSVTPNSTVTGTVEGTDGTLNVTLALSSGQVVQIPLAPYVTVTFDGQTSSLGAVAVGDQASVTVNAQGQASFIGVSAVGTSGGLSPNSTVSGIVQSVNSGQSLTLTVAGGPAVTAPLASGVIVTYNGQTSTLAAVGTGDSVTATVNGAGQIYSINVTSYGYGYGYPYGSTGQLAPNTTVTATVDSVQWPTSITLTVVGGPTATAALAPYASVTQNGLASGPSAVTAGDRVIVTVNSLDQVVTIGVEGESAGVTPNSTMTGTVEAIDGTQTVTISSTGGSSIVLPLAPTVYVSRNGSSAVGLGELAIGDDVSVILNGLGQVSTLNVVSSALGTGTVVTGYLAGVDQADDTVQVYGSGATSGLHGYTISSSAPIDRNGQTSSLAALQVGDSISLALNSLGDASAVSTASPVPPETVYTGTLEAAPTGATVILSTTTGTMTLNVGNEAVAVRGGNLIILSSLAAGESVSVVTQAGPLGSALILATS